VKICVVGAGAVGGLLGAELALAGEDVTLIARGDHLAAIKRRGLRLRLADGRERIAAECRSTADIEEVGAQDIVILAVKAHQISAVAPKLPSLYVDDTVVVTVQNGIPWWYFLQHGGDLDGVRLQSLDPDGLIEVHVPASRIVGSIAYPAVERTVPGVITVVEGNRFPVGELDGSKSERVRSVAQLFSRAGFRSRVVTDIRTQLWLKAWGSLAFNPISALTHATLGDICRFPGTRALAARMMREARTIADRLGVRLRSSIEQRIEGAAKIGAHRTSMLQDLEAGRPLELEALVGSFIELGRLTGAPTPSIEAVYACVKLRSQTR
jgi:2-dehydropantoate 2-reductase